MNIDQTVKEVIAEHLGLPIADVTEEKSLSQDLGADSLDAIDLLFAMNETFNIKLPSEKLENIETVQQLIEFVKAHQKS
ncbi:MAG: acyl carrier protein [Gammaproteobacteria bacterium]|nr:acyl carrier protein [Gammaproteobacteria bacterium]MCH9744886.1 acyl carrier protein [Gammaproteobacteria bacterium]